MPGKTLIDPPVIKCCRTLFQAPAGLIEILMFYIRARHIFQKAFLAIDIDVCVHILANAK